MIQIGFIGAGDIWIIHAQSVAKSSLATLKGIWNISPELAKEESRKASLEILSPICKNYKRQGKRSI